MDAPRKRQFTFGLRTLLTVVAVCAALCGLSLYLYHRPPYEARQVHIGMSQEEINGVMSGSGLYSPHEPMDMIQYARNWGELQVSFENGFCTSAAYRRYRDGKWFDLQPDGHYRARQ